MDEREQYIEAIKKYHKEKKDSKIKQIEEEYRISSQKLNISLPLMSDDALKKLFKILEATNK